jgi:hypothetical protein
MIKLIYCNRLLRRYALRNDENNRVKADLGNVGVKKISYTNVKKILLFEARHK